MRFEALPPPTQAEVERRLRGGSHRGAASPGERGVLPAHGPEDSQQAYTAHWLSHQRGGGALSPRGRQASVQSHQDGALSVGQRPAAAPASHSSMRRRATAAFIWTRRPAPTSSSALARSKPMAVRPARRSAQARVRPPRLAPGMRTWREGWEVTTSRCCTPTAAARRPGRYRRRPADHCPSSPRPVRRSSHHRQTSTRSSSRRSKR